jgi:AcrR family transcriptional regulator
MNRPTQHTTDDILAAAMAVFAEEGVGVSTARIAAAAGVSNGTLFNYFPTKQALIDALYVWIKNDLADAMGEFDDSEPLEQRMRQVWDRWLNWARRHRSDYAVANLLHQSGLASSSAQTVSDLAMAGPTCVLSEAKETGVLVDLPLEYLGAIVQHHIDQAVRFELDDRQADLAYQVLLNGITQQRPTP